jgi:hypothetical protein
LLSAFLAIATLVAAPSSSDLRRKGCKVPAGSTVVERSPHAVVFIRTTGKRGNELTTLYGCARGTGQRFRLWKCNAGQLTSDKLQTVRLRGRKAILEIERKPEEMETFFHLTRTVNLRTGKRRDSRSTSQPQAPGSKLIFDC